MSQKHLSLLIILTIILQVSVGLFTYPNQVKAANRTYYVSVADGSDTYDGLEQTHTSGSTGPFKTITKINAMTCGSGVGKLTAGDAVLFKNGETWREQLTVPCSGSSSNSITFGSYVGVDSSAVKPIITGANVITPGSAWSPVTGLYATVDSQPTKTGNPPSGIRNVTISSEQANQWLAKASFSITNVELQIIKVGIPTGNIFVKVYADSAGLPGTLLGQSNNVDVSTITTTVGGQAAEFNFSTPIAVISGNTYYISIAGDWTISASNYVKADYKTSGTVNFPQRFKYTPWVFAETKPYYMLIQKSITNIWQATGITTEPKVVLFNGSVGNKQTSTASLTSPNDWYWTGNTLYVYSTTDPDTAYTNPGIEIGQRNSAIYTYDHNYLNFQNITFTSGNVATVGLWSCAADLPVNTSNYITFDSVDILKGYQLGFYHTCDGTSSYISVRNSTIAYNGGTGILVSANTDHWTIEHNTFYNNGFTDEAGGVQNTWGAGVDIVSAPGVRDSNHIVQYNDIYYTGYKDNGITRVHAASPNKGFGIWIDTVDSLGDTANGNIVRYNKVHDNADSGLFNEKSSYHIWYGNLSYNNGEYGIRMDAEASGPASSNVVFYNNTVYGNASDGIHISGGYNTPASACLNNQIKNNISYGNTGRQFSAKWGCENDGTNGSGNIYTYNNFGPESSNFIEWGNGVYKSTYASLDTAYGSSTNSISGDPLLTNPGANNFTLQPGSPAIDTGVSLGTPNNLGLDPTSTWPSNVLTLNQDTMGSGYELGAYVYPASVSDSTPPTTGASGAITSASVTSSSLTLNWTKGTDETSAQSTLQYRVYQSSSNNIDTIPNIEANGTPLNSYTSNINTLNVTSLSASTTYYFNVIVKDEAGNKAAYTTKSQVTSSSLGGGGSGTYYVSNTGNDSCDGTSQTIGTSGTCAWKTIAKVNASTFQPGDSILFNKGDTWREQLTVSSSGAAGNPITFGDYGSGAMPVISGADLLSSSWTTEGSIYYQTISPPLKSELVKNSTFDSSNVNWDEDYNAVTPSWQSSPVGGRPNVLKISINGTYNYTGQDNIYTANGTDSYQLTFSYYIPSSNSIYKAIQVRDSSCFDSSCATGSLQTVTNTWTQASVNWTPTNGKSNIYFDATDTGGGEWQNPSGEIIYIDNVSIKQITPPVQVFKDGTRLTLASSKATLATGKWWWDYTNSRVYVYDNPSSHTLEFSSRDYCISVSDAGQNYITITNLQVQMAQSVDIASSNVTNFTVTNVLAQDSYGAGIQLYSNLNSTVQSSTLAYNGSDGFSGGDLPNLLISGVIAHNNGVYANDIFSAGIKLQPDYGSSSSTNVIIKNSESYSNGIGHAGSGEFIGAGIWADTIGDGLIMENNITYGNNIMGLYFDVVNNGTMIGNISYGNGQPGAIDGGGIAVYADGRTTTTNKIYNNTVYGNNLSGIKIFGSNLSSGCNNMLVKNNIAIGTTSGPNLWSGGGCENSNPYGSGNIYTYNNFGPESLNFISWGGVNKSTYASFESAYCGTTGCSNSIQANPLFTNPGSNIFTLQTTSPAIDTGVSLGTPYNLGLDGSSTWPNNVLTLNQDSYGLGYEIGAYVYIPAPKAITAFNFTTPAVTGTMNETNHTITLTVPFGTDVTALIPTITTNGASISPNTGVAHDFTNPVTYTVTATDNSTQNYVVTVTVAAQNTHIITATTGENGSISPSGSVSVNNGSDQSFTITPNSGYHINTVTVDGSPVSTTSSYTFTNVTTTHTISVTFAATAVSGGGGGSGGGSYTYTPPPTSTNILGCDTRIIGFSTTTGQSCANNVTVNISGCDTRTTGFSTTTGQSCRSNPSVSQGQVTTKYNLGTVTLRNGSRGDAVKELQRFLNDRLNLGLVLDGVFGPKTTLIVMKWQSNHGLVTDGLVGNKTKGVMNSL